MSRSSASHRAVRRRGRAGLLALALGVTIVVGGAAAGLVPQLDARGAAANSTAATRSVAADLETTSLAVVATPTPSPTPTAAVSAVVVPAVPAGSGDGRRIVFDQSDQRVWLIGDDNTVTRTYLVSGSRFDNLRPGSYSVSSKSRWATSFDYTGKLEYFVRFATGFSAPIGFHAVPRFNNGQLEQTKAQLGTPLSAGCVRQWMPDAIALWNFAPIGTKVYVTA